MSFACWLVVAVDNVFKGVAAAWALSTTPNCGGGKLVLALGEGVDVVTISNLFVGVPNTTVSDYQSEDCCRRSDRRSI
jgi:hypothetical protein